jgi:hypothetical protein
MKRAPTYLTLVALLACIAAVFGAGRNDPGYAGAAGKTLSILLPGKGFPAPDPVQPYFGPARKSDRIERVSLPEFVVQRINDIPVDEARVLLPDAPPSSRFLKGVFHRYRPRDPTVS